MRTPAPVPRPAASAATALTVISQFRAAQRRALIGRIAFGLLFVANAMLLGTILGLLVAWRG